MKRINLLLILTLASCTVLGTPPSILDDSSCDPPCWHEVMVGVTTGEEMLAILRELSIVDQNIAVLSPWLIYDGGLNFYLYPNGFYKHNVVVDSRFFENNVAEISFCGDPGVSFGDVVERTGEPKNMIILGSPSGGSFVTAINEDIGVQFWYDTKNVSKSLRSEIAPEIPIDCLVYFDPEFYDERLEAGLVSMGHLNAEETLEAMRPWTGYGNLNEKYPPRQP